PDQQGPQALDEMRVRGKYWLDLAELQGQPLARTQPARRPSPIPPAPALREMSVTEVRTLIRDPYAIYARKVLGLRALDPLRPEPGAAERGTILHDIMDHFLRGLPALPESPELMSARLLEITDRVLADKVPWPSARLFWMADEAARLTQGRPVVVEDYGSTEVPGMAFRLIARPDRMDRLTDGQVHVYDYKSGAAPTDRQIALFDKQLPLTAAMVEQGAFRDLGRA
ncbi:MAG TPA: PD-(D/E)XK nuclease family protein, partial [Paracoccus sp. (in: a-proteobacteria)]|nr:PD-(D/E)XK nuclease family protein [Paracoccus sp. (in: a-proteobacteria)]